MTLIFLVNAFLSRPALTSFFKSILCLRPQSTYSKNKIKQIKKMIKNLTLLKLNLASMIVTDYH